MSLVDERSSYASVVVFIVGFLHLLIDLEAILVLKPFYFRTQTSLRIFLLRHPLSGLGGGAEWNFGGRDVSRYLHGSSTIGDVAGY
jgi:hypothetical protein